ncbi:MAG TPA: xanthine dehydrogenase accessory protein XdhC [Candidatus Baltobacteraceae bacterium]
MTAWVSELARLAQSAQGTVIATVLNVRGSTPREIGAKLLVTRDRTFGSIGGGRLEFDAVALARAVLGGQSESFVHRFVLGASLGQCCGGLAEVLFEPVSPGVPWIGRLAALDAERRPCVIVRPLLGDGDETMLVWEQGAFGALHDHVLSASALRSARAMLAAPAPAIACSPMTVFETVGAGLPNVVIFGAGHIGRALVAVLAPTPCRITWVDSREEQFPETLPANVNRCCTDEPLAAIDAATPGSDFLVMTHDHALDFALSARILRRDDVRFFGLVGSVTKRRSFESRLAKEGLEDARISRMHCPLGLEGIRRKDPASIAVAIAAQLLCGQATDETQAARAIIDETAVAL